MTVKTLEVSRENLIRAIGCDCDIRFLNEKFGKYKIVDAGFKYLWIKNLDPWSQVIKIKYQDISSITWKEEKTFSLPRHDITLSPKWERFLSEESRL